MPSNTHTFKHTHLNLLSSHSCAPSRSQIDPEELKEAQAALRGETGSSSQQPQQRIQGGGASR